MKSIAIFGATGGLGADIATTLARRAAVCLGYGQNQTRADELARDIAAAGGKAVAQQVDIRDPDSVQHFIATASTLADGLDAIVFATGPALSLRPLVEVSDEDFDRIYRTDVRGAFNVIKHGSLALKDAGGGSIVMILTAAVLRTLEHDGMSGGPKTAVAALIKQTAREMGPHNVRCNGLALAVIDAGIIYADNLVNDPYAQGVINAMVSNTPLGRMGRPEEVSAVVDFLVSPGAGYISGQIIGVDGGFSA